MFKNFHCWKIDLTQNINLLDKRTNQIIGRCGYLKIEGEILDVDYQEVSYLPDNPILELPNSKKLQELENIFEKMFQDMVTQST